MSCIEKEFCEVLFRKTFYAAVKVIFELPAFRFFKNEKWTYIFERIFFINFVCILKKF